MGISETVVHFVLYEGVKARLMAARTLDGVPSDQRSPKDFLEFMAAGAFSKTVASCIAYPHGKFFRAVNTYQNLHSRRDLKPRPSAIALGALATGSYYHFVMKIWIRMLTLSGDS